MTITSNLLVQLALTVDQLYSQQFEAIANTTSPAQFQTISLASGANTITVPSGSTGVLIIPPPGNTNSITLKGVSGDTGISLSKTSLTYISLSSVSSFVLTTGGIIIGTRFVFI